MRKHVLVHSVSQSPTTVSSSILLRYVCCKRSPRALAHRFTERSAHRSRTRLTPSVRSEIRRRSNTSSTASSSSVLDPVDLSRLGPLQSHAAGYIYWRTRFGYSSALVTQFSLYPASTVTHGVDIELRARSARSAERKLRAPVWGYSTIWPACPSGIHVAVL